MTSDLFDPTLQRALELVGICAFASSGALLAIRKDFDVVGILVLATLTALGGGVLRDVIIGTTPPVAFTELSYLVLPTVVATIAVFAHPTIERMIKGVLIFDAAGLGLFCVVGTITALNSGIGPVQSVALGVATGVGGGVLRDVVARDTPVLVRADSELYAVPAAIGASAVAIANEAGWYSPAVGIGAAAFIFALRVAAMLFHWHAPRARG